MASHQNQRPAAIPTGVKVFTWVLICAGLFFGYVFMFNPALAFPGAAITDYSSRLGFYSTSVRVFGSVAALLISVLLNRADLLAITLASRLFIEVGDVIVGLVIGGTMVNTLMVSVIALFELWATLQLLKAIRNHSNNPAH